MTRFSVFIWRFIVAALEAYAAQIEADYGRLARLEEGDVGEADVEADLARLADDGCPHA